MSLVAREKKSATVEAMSSPTHSFNLRSWLLSWEIYLLVLVAAFLRLYQIHTTEFDGDQAMILGMARYAIEHGLWIATSNYASIRIVNPPGIIYLLLIPAWISANPVSAAIFTALCAILAVLLTYFFVRRYYGRLAATIAALLYATATKAVFYSRFSWNQNMLPLFVLLLFFCLFWGVVERRKGWFGPAVFLIGLLVQLHATGAYMIAPFLLAVCLAPKTIRWRDVLLGAVLLLISYAPYLIWEISTHFSDVAILLTPTNRPTLVDNWALVFYQLMISPYEVPFTNTHSLLYKLVPFIGWLRNTMTILLITAAVMALLKAVWPTKIATTAQQKTIPVLGAIGRWWLDLCSTPYRCGLLILLVWQLVMFALVRHSLPLYLHYFIIFMPGPFILIGIFIAKVVLWFRERGSWNVLVSAAMVLLSLFIVFAQFAGTTADVLDMVQGNFHDHARSNPYYNDLASLQHALTDADQLAQKQHLERVYIAADRANALAISYLASQMHTPTTIFNCKECLVLPTHTTGPVAMLVSPYSTFVDALLKQFTQAKLVDSPPRLGGDPFRLYVVSNPDQLPSARQTFSNQLQLFDTHLRLIKFNNASWQVSHWGFLHAKPLSFNSTYTYMMTASPASQSKLTSKGLCELSSLHPGDELLMAFRENSATLPLKVTVRYQESRPYDLPFGPLALETGVDQITPWTTLKIMNGNGATLLSPATGVAPAH
ncbi:hypothetical protein EPA93_41415 [Ktedonosporobacter rubrisoli]|uniref:Glycosyltransferase RgtA/B/C/D-like domain-containing protein n=1 Tax=Ktedonosporobacter rubrisoli TaxID=2509675 RepID=A0A4P6K1P5_KTERU|nr:glycosyltransferase family 39 protein [Ktedonosporobacter rubrisoli]QBD82097.1 hypothetical protein EPA93_41415 [Ktedonosporobacter rubrisoli]